MSLLKSIYGATQHVASATHNLAHGVAKQIADNTHSPLVGKHVTIGSRTVKIKQQLAEGGYSFVYIAKDVSNGELFALKRMVCQDRDMLRLAREEAKILDRLRGHPTIVGMYGHTEERESNTTTEVYILLELCGQGHLVDLLNRQNRQPLSEGKVWKIFREVCDAVAFLHSQNPPIVHRDLKIENVLQNDQGAYKLCDFGSCTTQIMHPTSRKAILEIEEEVQKMTTLAYRSPEMVDLYRQQTIGPKADVWALGCILFRLAFFDHPFDDGANLQIINGVYTIPSNSTFSPLLHAMIKFCLVADPDERPSSEKVLKLVDDIVAGRGAEVRGYLEQRGKDGPASPSRSGSRSRNRSGSWQRSASDPRSTAPPARPKRQTNQNQHHHQQQRQQQAPRAPPRQQLSAEAAKELADTSFFASPENPFDSSASTTTDNNNNNNNNSFAAQFDSAPPPDNNNNFASFENNAGFDDDFGTFQSAPAQQQVPVATPNAVNDFFADMPSQGSGGGNSNTEFGAWNYYGDSQTSSQSPSQQQLQQPYHDPSRPRPASATDMAPVHPPTHHRPQSTNDLSSLDTYFGADMSAPTSTHFASSSSNNNNNDVSSNASGGPQQSPRSVGAASDSGYGYFGSDFAAPAPAPAAANPFEMFESSTAGGGGGGGMEAMFSQPQASPKRGHAGRPMQAHAGHALTLPHSHHERAHSAPPPKSRQGNGGQGGRADAGMKKAPSLSDMMESQLSSFKM